MQKLFNPRSVAVIGASETKGKIGNILVKNLSDGGYRGKIYPINPKHKKINGLVCYEKISDIDDEIDMVIIAIPAQLVPKAVEECAWHKHLIKNIVIISAGFSESGKEGALLEAEIKNLAKEYQLNVIGPNCLGIVNTENNLNASFAKLKIKKGKVGLVMQSGALTTALIDLAEKNSFGFSQIITLGNKATVDEVDVIDYFATEQNTEMVVFYLETIKRGSKFIDKLSKLATKKPVFILKAGNSKRVQAAIQSHTGAMAGEIEVIKKAIKQSGAMYFDNIAELTYALKFFSAFKIPKNKKTVMVTNAGGPGVIATDLIERADNLEMLELEEEIKQCLAERLVSASSVKNPVDVLGDADSGRYDEALGILSKSRKLGSVLVLVTPQAQTDIEGIARVIIDANEKYPFPVVPVFIGGPAGVEADELLSKAGLGNFEFPSSAINALSRASEFSARIIIKPKKTTKANVSKQNSAQLILDKVVKEKREGLFYQEAIELAKIYGIESEKAFCLESESALKKVGKNLFPVVMKIDDPKILHKNLEKGVVLNIKNGKELEKAFLELKDKFKNSKIIIQKQLSIGTEIILGIKNDPSFGKVVLAGLGGIFTEILNEKNLWITPVDEREIKKDLENSALAKVFEKSNLDLSQLISQVEKVAELAEENEQIKELDINPMFFYEDRKPVAVDIKGLLQG